MKAASSLLRVLFVGGQAGLLLVTTAAGADDQPAAPVAALKGVTVTGSSIPRTSKETASPVQIITRTEIERSGLSTTSDVVRAVSADNSGSLPTAFSAGFAEGASGVALRGLTVNSTLVLIDGRRVATYALADDGERSFVDLNTIPLGAVDRIEVLKDGASSIYGADAIAGVVNIILLPSYKGAEVEGEAGAAQHGGGLMKRFSALLGTGNLPTDKHNVYVSLEYEKDDRILASQRDYPFNSFNLAPIGGFNFNGGQPTEESGSIYGTVAPATLGSTGQYTPNALYQPLNPCGPGTKQITSHNTNPLTSNGTWCSQNFVDYTDDQPADERFGINGRFSIEIADDVIGYLNASFYDNKVRVDGTPPQIQTTSPNNTSNIVLPVLLSDGSLNPNNPFAGQGDPALINYAFGDIAGGSTTDNQVYRMVGGIKGSYANWEYDTALVINHTSLYNVNYGFLNYTQLVADINNGSYHFNHALGPTSAAVLDTLSSPIAKTSTTDLDMVDFRANRELWHLPGGPLGFAVGAEYRYEATNDPDLNPSLQYQGLGIAHTIGSHDVAALYSEIDAMLLKSLELNVSGRYDHYTDVADHGVTPKVGIKYTPIEQVALRGTFSEGFRAPSFSENGSSAAEGFVPITPDQNSAFVTSHGGDAYASFFNLAQYSSANRGIEPEKAQNFTLGTVLQPVKQLSLSLDYYHIKKTNLIEQPDYGEALDAYLNGQPIPSGFTVTPDLPDPAHPNALPRPVMISAAYTNASSLTTQGWDADIQLTLKPYANMKVISELNTTEIASFKVVQPNGTTEQFVGTEAPYNLSSGAGTPRWKASWANTLIVGPATGTLTAYYVSGYTGTGVDATGDASVTTGCIYPLGNTCRINHFIDFDLTGEYKLPHGFTVFGDIRNLFDDKPPVNAANYAATNYNPTYTQAGIIGRFFSAGLRYKF